MVDARMFGVNQADQAQELFELLFGELRDRLGMAGWQPMGQPGAAAFDFAFIKQLRGDFAATCSVLPPLRMWFRSRS